MATAKKPTPPTFVAGRFAFKSQDQLDFFMKVLARNNLSVADVEARYSEKTLGFQALNRLLQVEEDANVEAMQGKAPTDNQDDAIPYYIGLADAQGKTVLAQQLRDLNDRIADRAEVHLAIRKARQILVERQAESTPPSAPNTDAGFGDEKFGG